MRRPAILAAQSERSHSIPSPTSILAMSDSVMRRLLCFSLWIFSLPVFAQEEPAKAFATWSAFPWVDLQKVSGGKILTHCNTSMQFARGLSAQAVFVVGAPPESAVQVLLNSDPSQHPELEVYQAHSFSGEHNALFGKLKLNPQFKPVRRLLEAMPKGDGLQITREERALLPKDEEAGSAQIYWANILRDRWRRAASQGDFGTVEGYDLRQEMNHVIAEEPKIVGHFHTLLAPIVKRPETGLTGMSSYYWDISNVNKMATACLGAVAHEAADNRQRLLDFTIYASSGYLSSITLYEMVPITVGGKPGALVWQGCLVSAVELAGGFGIKRQIASVLMTNELEQSARLFQQDVEASKR